jgi:hypothetical protein
VTSRHESQSSAAVIAFLQVPLGLWRSSDEQARLSRLATAEERQRDDEQPMLHSPTNMGPRLQKQPAAWSPFMRQLKSQVSKQQWHPRRHLGRKVTAIAVVAAAGVLLAYLLQGSRAVSSYAGARAENAILKASARARSCISPTVVRMNYGNAQSGVTKGAYYITNDTWNADGYKGLSQAIHVCNYNSWYATATMNNDSGNGAVKTSPNVQETWYPTPTKLSRWESISSQFSDLPPGAGPKYGIWEFEYDIWLNGLANSDSTEIMIWTFNNGQTPAGSSVGSFTNAGKAYDVYRTSPPRQYIAFVDRSSNLSGSLNLLDFFKYVISRGWMPASSTLYQICHGVELVSTNGKPEKFAIENFSIRMKAYSLG